MRLEGLGQLKNPMTSSGTETRGLPACSTVPQPTTLPRALCQKEIPKYQSHRDEAQGIWITRNSDTQPVFSFRIKSLSSF
jgi:hypothetical protein